MPRYASSALLVIVLAGLFHSRPIADIDFWWHVANGRWIVDHRALPTDDPFGVYPVVNDWSRTILQGQWAGQVILFAAFAAGGAPAVVLLRVVLLGTTLGLLAWQLRESAPGSAAGAPLCSVATRLLALAAGATLLAGFAADRPQLFSLLLFSLLLVVLAASRRRYRIAWLAPPLLALWANLHQGVLLGTAVALLWIGVDAWRDRRTADRAALAHRLAALVAAALAPLCSPNGLGGVGYLLWQEFEPAKARISEYGSPFLYLGMSLDNPALLIYFSCLPLLLVALARGGRDDWLDQLVPAFLIVASLTSYRYTPFAVLAGLPLLVRRSDALIQAKPRLCRWLVGLLLLPVVLAGALSVRQTATVLDGAISRRHFPVALTARAQTAGLAGRGFTTVNWGGYLGWELAAGRPFIDGRFMMNTARLDDYTHMLWATPRGQMLFERADFAWVLMPYRNAFAHPGETYPLIGRLQQDPRWQVLSADEQGVLLVRR